MSKSKKDFWTVYEDMHKTEKIIRDVLGWECFLSWEAYYHKYHAQEMELLNTGKTYTTPTPVAFYVDYVDTWRVFSPDHEELNMFDPLHKLADAWLLVGAINKPVDGSYARYAAFTDALALKKDDQHLTPERICDAALQAIEQDEKPVEITPNDRDTIEGIKEVQRLQWLAERIEKRREQ